jgi:hypothetical protein
MTDNQPNQPSLQQAEMKAVEGLDTNSIVNPGTKKQSSPTHEPPTSPQNPPEPDVGTQFDETPTTKRRGHHSGLIEQGITIYASNMEEQIAAEARGVTRKNIPWDKFYSIYLRGFVVEPQSILTVESMKEIGDGDWKEKLFLDRLDKVLSDEVRYSGCAFIYLSVFC